MRKLTLILTTLIFSVMFSSSTSFAGWTKVDEDVGATFYVDFESIKKRGGYVYYWVLVDLLKPTEYGILSGKGYVQGDCKKFRYKWLSGTFHKGPMGGGTGEVSEPPERHKGWKYPPPDSVIEEILKSVCQYAR